MGAVKELIRAEADGPLSFGDYTLGAKAKLDNLMNFSKNTWVLQRCSLVWYFWGFFCSF